MRRPGIEVRGGWHRKLACGMIGLLAMGAVASVEAGGSVNPFTEEAVQRGIDYPIQYLDSFGSGVAFADLDHDGDPDLVVVGRTTPVENRTVGVFENDGSGNFTDRSPGSRIPILPVASGVTAADYDGDGDLDLYITNWLQPNKLFRNDGSFVFTDVSATAQVDDDGAGAGCGWGDYNNDGWLDLYVANRTQTNLPDPPYPPSLVRNKLYRNLGNGTFVNEADNLDVTYGDSISFQGAFFDYDRDSDPDLFLASDKGVSQGCVWFNQLWENVGGTFVNVSEAAQVDDCVDGMCIAIGDIDNNRWLDVYVSNLPPGNKLYLNQTDKTFTEFSGPAGVGSYQVGWGSLFSDIDNDGFLEIYSCNHSAPNRLYDFDGTWPALDVADIYAVDHDSPGQSFCVAAADIDNDGDTDLAVTNRQTRLFLYINQEGAQRRWAKFNVVGRRENHFGVGARVEVRTGSTWRTREVIAGSGLKSQDDLTLHFGLDSALVMDEVRVVWPWGVERTLHNLPSKQTWQLYPDERLGDATGDGAVTASDVPAFLDCVTGIGDAVILVGCEMMDFDGDSDVDLSDYAAFMARFAG